MKVILSLLALCTLGFNAYSQLDNYKIYNAKGKEVKYEKMIKGITVSDVVLFGELHNNVIAHWLELEVLKSLASTNNTAVGLEMFERDNQNFIQQYLKDSITPEAFDSLVRFWPNYETDYAPLLNYCKEDSIPFHATNIPRRFANMVYKNDFNSLDTLSTEEKSWIAPMPIVFYDTLPQYQAILDMMGGHGSPNLVKAQAMKDATMAYFTLQLLAQQNVDQVLHFNGSFHSNYYEGIYWYLNHYQADLSIATIAVVEQENLSKLLEENKGKADYIIVVDSDFPTSY